MDIRMNGSRFLGFGVGVLALLPILALVPPPPALTPPPVALGHIAAFGPLAPDEPPPDRTIGTYLNATDTYQFIGIDRLRQALNSAVETEPSAQPLIQGTDVVAVLHRGSRVAIAQLVELRPRALADDDWPAVLAGVAQLGLQLEAPVQVEGTSLTPFSFPLRAEGFLWRHGDILVTLYGSDRAAVGGVAAFMIRQNTLDAVAPGG